ncbi:MAG: rod shape-determining protein RodA [Chthoniobacterales bacterium]
MHPLLRKLLGINWTLAATVFALAFFGVYAIYSATWFRDAPFWKNQILWILVGTPAFLFAALLDYRWIRWGALPFYIFSIALLVAVRVVGVERYGSSRWIDLGPISIQPSQIAIFAGILMVALFLSRFQEIPAILKIIGTAVIVGAPCLLILIQPDLGSTIVWGPVILAMFFVAGIPKRYLIVMLLCVVITVPLAVNFVLKPYQRDRIMAFIDNDIDPLGVSWTINQSLIAIGSGGLAGKGFKAENTQNELGFLPSTIVHNDFIFSAFAEQHGFIGGFLLLCAYAFLILLCLQIAMAAEDELGKLVVVGIATMIATHVFMNIGMTISVTPITGLPLPLVSYGGTFMASILAAFGLIQSIWIHRKMGV